MDGKNWRAPQAQAGEAVGAMDSGEWRTQLLPGSRQRIVNKIMEILRRHLPVSGERLEKLKSSAARFEEKTYTAATSQHDYLRKISLKMLSMEKKYQNPNAHCPGEQ
ncbi:mediator of RNA polymerase II transcription subunit 15a-like isoform X2 [Lycium ferocissimum]|uniref:mediator of RNA polymerase II transcription subunit 15a-like isoform X2 n=1 Tax=Lycium ferocissimum TaxID=112874 RepID=UPI002814A09F|nr:mediator of RNA polymerase II transcription subunit 15a-like isoform X2 [Lycium ferocissimum]